MPLHLQVSFFLSNNMLLEEAKALAAELKRRLKFSALAKKPRIILAGSARREEPRNRDLDLLVIVPKLSRKVMASVLASASLKDSKNKNAEFISDKVSGPRRRSMIIEHQGANTYTNLPNTNFYTNLHNTNLHNTNLHNTNLHNTNLHKLHNTKLPNTNLPKSPNLPLPIRTQVDLFLVEEKDLPYALFHYTGSSIYNIRTRAHAKAHGMLLNQYGVFDVNTKRRARGSSSIKSEKDLADFLGVSYRSPTDRKK